MEWPRPKSADSVKGQHETHHEKTCFSNMPTPSYIKVVLVHVSVSVLVSTSVCQDYIKLGLGS